MDLPLAFTEEQTARPLSQKLETAVKRLGKSLDHAVFLINGQFMEHSQFIHPQKSEDNKKNNKNESGKKLSGPIQFRSRPKDKWSNTADSTINKWRSGSLGPLFIPASQELTAAND